MQRKKNLAENESLYTQLQMKTNAQLSIDNAGTYAKEELGMRAAEQGADGIHNPFGPAIRVKCSLIRETKIGLPVYGNWACRIAFLKGRMGDCGIFSLDTCPRNNSSYCSISIA